MSFVELISMIDVAILCNNLGSLSY